MKRDRKASINRKKRAEAFGSIRVIGGQFKGRKLPVLDAEGLRPTTDRVKETLFNWLMHEIRDAKCLDLFAGSGSLGLEAISRYSAAVTFVEKDKQAFKQIQANLQLLNVANSQQSTVHTDAFDFLNSTQTKFDIIFVDPPFGKDLLLPAIEAILGNELLGENGLLYVEHESTLHLDLSTVNLKVVKEKHTASLNYKLLALI
jgi:16S rRNA (guanine966-N2)-methyltransferase